MESIIITGANSGIGYECARHLATLAPDHQLVLACRNVAAGNDTLQKIRQQTQHPHLVCLPLDLASSASIRAFTALVAALPEPRVAALVNNAGLQIVGPTRYTRDGFEETFGVNHLGPLYLTLQLLPFLTTTARITFTASGTHDPRQKTGMPAPQFKDPRLLAYPDDAANQALSVGQQRYTTSKLCNVLTAYELQRRLAHTAIHVNAFDPGLVPGTGLARNYPPVLRFVASQVFRLMLWFHPNVHTAPTSGKRLAELAFGTKYADAKGKYIEGEKEIPSSEDSYNRTYQAQLWKGSLELLGLRESEVISQGNVHL
jgi:NAD(P)-dependent dehydrogenase (short-subunit alcohol dehydrogenase family)